MASTTNKPFHTYENVGFEDQANLNHQHYVPPPPQPQSPPQQHQPTPLQSPQILASSASLNCSNNNSGVGGGQSLQQQPQSVISVVNHAAIAINKTAIDSPFPDPMIIHDPSSTTLPNNTAARILSTTDSSGTTRMLTTSTKSTPGQNLVTKLITLPNQSPMDQIKEWSVSTYKCTKQFINEKRGNCSITNDAQLLADIEQLRENRSKLSQMLRTGQQMTNHYTQLVRTQKQLYDLMNEMSIKCFTSTSQLSNNNNNSTNYNNNSGKKHPTASKHIVASFSSLGNNLSSSTTTNDRSNSGESYDDFLPVLNHMQVSNTNLVDDFKKNAISLNIAIKNGEKLISALNFYCSNLSTLIDKTIEDTLSTVKQYELSRLEYDAERNSLNFISSAQSAITYSSDRLEIARIRYEQLKEEVQIKLKFLEENTIKVMHKQLLLFNGAFASYTSGNTAALDAILKQFCIK